MKMKKTLLLMLSVIVVMSMLAACSSKNNNAGSGNTPPPADTGSGTDNNPDTNKGEDGTVGGTGNTDPKTITFSTISNYYTDGLKEAAVEYNKLHPETTVKIDVQSDNNAYITSFQAKMSAGGDNAPDIVHTNLTGDKPGANITKGWFVKLNDYVKQPNPYNEGTSIWDGVDENYHANMYSEAGDVALLPFDLVGTGFYYNKAIFEKAGITDTPATWEDLLADLQKIKDSDSKIIPLAMPFLHTADYEGWMRGAFVDWALRPLIADFLVQEGDGIATPQIVENNKKIVYEAGKPMFDVGGVVSQERIMDYAMSGKYDLEGPAEQKYWTLLKDLSKFYEPGYSTMGDSDLYKLFISGKAAVYWNGSWQVGQLVQDQQKLGDKGFEWGTFKFPNFSQPDPNFPDDPRGILAVGHQLSIVQKKDAEQVKRAEDFMQYLFSPKVAQKVYETTLAAGQFVQGPSLVKGVQLSDEINGYLEGFLVSGNMNGEITRISTGNPNNDVTAGTEFKALQLKFYQGDIDLAEFLKQKAAFVKRTNQKFIDDNKMDLDPKTNP
ncbi:ABC transporter substrate-binding protein [Paenibacillus nasutitermitis]|uniref:ABC transporter substrate-binding protein n=1 Tax=Paenibacillus nasutitermitis TaxID=1652958 RepID=A0A916ZH52_9BACL|nr:ABC transporter substrate-binding protein [Paenibacillus nasutitermitis]GGD98125.1 hypothetical protein GCM10010911_66160 [Paenibacillus nasutitermitis]